MVTVSSMQRFPAGTSDSRLSSFSNRGLGKIDVAAPGSSILSTIVDNNGYGTKSGTSMASPHVAGVLALMKSVHPTWTPAQMIAKLRSQADDKACGTTTAGPACVGTPADNSYFGEGVVDALDAVELTRTAPGGGRVTPGVARPPRVVEGPWRRRVRTDAAPRLPLTPILTHQIRTDDP